jgi:hypothetical protein
VTEILLPLFCHTAWARAISAACIRAYAAFSKLFRRRMAPGKCSIWTFLRGLPRRCFEQCAGHNAGLGQESNQRAFCSPEPSWTPCRLPNTP